jgi:hypothetical protein
MIGNSTRLSTSFTFHNNLTVNETLISALNTKINKKLYQYILTPALYHEDGFSKGKF